MRFSLIRAANNLCKNCQLQAGKQCWFATGNVSQTNHSHLLYPSTTAWEQFQSCRANNQPPAQLSAAAHRSIAVGASRHEHGEPVTDRLPANRTVRNPARACILGTAFFVHSARLPTCRACSMPCAVSTPYLFQLSFTNAKVTAAQQHLRRCLAASLV